MNRIQSSNGVLEISSFSGMLAGFCGVVSMGAVYGWFAGKASAVDLAIILFLRCRFLMPVGLSSRCHFTGKRRSAYPLDTIDLKEDFFGANLLNRGGFHSHRQGNLLSCWCCSY